MWFHSDLGSFRIRVVNDVVPHWAWRLQNCHTLKLEVWNTTFCKCKSEFSSWGIWSLIFVDSSSIKNMYLFNSRRMSCMRTGTCECPLPFRTPAYRMHFVSILVSLLTHMTTVSGNNFSDPESQLPVFLVSLYQVKLTAKTSYQTHYLLFHEDLLIDV